MNSLLGELEVKILDRTFVLKPTFEGLVEVEERAGCSLARLVNKVIMGDAGIRDVTAIVFGCALGAAERNQPLPSHADLGVMIMNHGFTKLLPACGKIVGAAYSGKPIALVEQADAKKKDQPAPAPTAQEP